MKILLSGDGSLFCDAMAHYLEQSQPDMDVICAKDFYGLMGALETHAQIDLVLLDMESQNMDGLSGIVALKQSYPCVPVALLSSDITSGHVRQAMAIGVNGCLPRTLSGRHMIHAIHRIIAGEKFLPQDRQSLPSLMDAREDPAAPVNLTDIQLTPRETQVLEYLMRGISNRDIADALNLRVVTIKMHVRAICRKLGAGNRTQAALLARQNGLA